MARKKKNKREKNKRRIPINKVSGMGPHEKGNVYNQNLEERVREIILETRDNKKRELTKEEFIDLATDQILINGDDWYNSVQWLLNQCRTIILTDDYMYDVVVELIERVAT